MSEKPDVDPPELPEVATLLKRALGDGAPDDVRVDRTRLEGVQRRLRERSGGKFYGDGWSTRSSRVDLVVVATAMLVITIAVYLALGPTGFSR